MKVRKLAVALALAGGLGSGMANALGLGEIELQSWLNEPLDAEISLRQSRGVNPADVFVNVAPEAAYERVGLERNQFLRKLRFEVVTAPDGGLAINVSSREPLREPYLNFLLELTWPNGRLMREYAVLVDPPVYAEESGLEAPVNAPTTASDLTSPEQSAESRRRQAEAERSLSGTGAREDTYGPTTASDTLWSIARDMRPDSSVSMHQAMLAIQEANPDAFIGGNINRLKRGQVLRVPSEAQMLSRSRREADRLVAEQNQSVESSSEPAGDPASEGDSELKLLVADDADSAGRSSEDGGSAGGDGDLPGGQDAGAAIAGEQVDALQRENEELSSRLSDMEQQVETLQRLLELKDSQLAELQNMAGQDGNSDVVNGNGAVAGTEQSEQNASADQTETLSDGAASDAGNEAAAVTEATDAVQSGDEERAAASSAGEAESESAAQASPENGSAEPASEQAAPAELAGQNEVAAPEAPEADAEPVDAVAPPEPVNQPAPPTQKSFPGNIVDAIISNPLYQVALGGGLVLLLLVLLLIKRKRAAAEPEDLEQENVDSAENADESAFDLSLDENDSEEQGEEAEEAIANADRQMEAGAHTEAANTLEEAISKEPSRTDLRLKLLSVYAISQNVEAFEKQYSELTAMDDEQATAQADDLRGQLDEATSGPSIDDLESQLRSDTSFAPATDELAGFGEIDAPEASEEASEQEQKPDAGESDSDEKEDIEFDLSLADLENDLEAGDGVSGEEVSKDTEEALAEEESEFGLIDFDLDSSGDAEGIVGDEPETSDTATEFNEEWPSLELEESPELEELSAEFEETESEKPENDTENSPEDSLSLETASLDDSFLDELDAELDKDASDSDAEQAAPAQEPDAKSDELDSLDMDLSEEDLAIMDELSDSEDIPSLDEDVDALDNSDGSDADKALEEKASAGASAPVMDFDENDLGDDDDFDFLAGTDEAATKLDLARAYVEMGDSEGARDILEEVALEGTDEQKAEAQALLKNLS